jgi:hypothetical protein
MKVVDRCAGSFTLGPARARFAIGAFGIALSLAASALVAPDQLKMSEHGVGPVTPQTRADMATLRRLFSGYSVTHGLDYMEDRAVGQKFTVRWKDKEILHVHTGDPRGTTISVVEVVSPDVTGPHGLHVGVTFDALYRLGAPTCARGEEQEADHVYCNLPNESFAYEADVSGMDAADEKLWTQEQVPVPVVLQKMKVHALLWFPNRK